MSASSWAAHRRRLLVGLVAASPLLLVLAASLDHQRRAGLDPDSLEVAVRGRPERCLACHQKEAEALAPAHRSPAVGCSSCHLGNPLSFDRARAHRGMERLPGDLSTARQACGERDCHPDAVTRVGSSLMATARGIVSVDRFAFGETDRPDGDRTVAEVSASAAPASPAESHLRKLCLSCHLATRHASPTERSRGGGCTACHLVAGAPGRAHPQLGVGVSAAACTGCHSRSGRISLSYYGWHEGASRLAADRAGEPSAERNALADGREVQRAVADVHADASLACLDCHTSLGVMGDGESYGHEEQQVDVACTDCHGRGGPARIGTLAEGETVALRIRRLLDPGAPAVGAPVARTRRGTSLSGVRQNAAGGWVLRRRVDGRELSLTQLPEDPAHTLRGHERLSCQACHTRWTHQCNSCHTSFEAGAEQVDHGSGRRTEGAWRERTGTVLIDRPSLGVNAGGRIVPFAPGMPLCVDEAERPERSAPGMRSGLDLQVGESKRCRRLFAPAEPHTTRKEARSCASCHRSGLALGLGRGEVRRTAGAWQFVPEGASPDPQPTPTPWPDGVGWDGWTRLDGTPLAETTRTGARPLSPDELRRVLEVGRCIDCHSDYADPIYRDFAASAAQRRAGKAPRCALTEP